MFLYETHLHTSPVSKCARTTVKEYINFYKAAGYDGVFVTNHFIDGNINLTNQQTHKAKIDYYFSDYEDALQYGKQIGFKVFLGVELSYKGTHFLVYGLDKKWYLDHPEIVDMKMTDKLSIMSNDGALIIQAHPYREAGYINHIRLFPRHVDGVETFNGGCTELENEMSKLYAKHYNLIEFYGSDIHKIKQDMVLGGIKTKRPIQNEQDFINIVKQNNFSTFLKHNDIIKL